MSYLPSSRLYECEPEATPAAPLAAPKPAPPAPKPAASSPRRATMKPKEWLVAPPPVLHVEASTPIPAPEPPVETITVPVSETPAAAAESPAGRKRNLFHKAHKVVLRHLDRAKRITPEPGEPDLLWFAVMATGSLCMGLMIWGAYSALPRFGHVGHGPLRSEASTRKLKASNDVPVWVRESSSFPAPPHAPPPVPPLVSPVPSVVLPPSPQAPSAPFLPVSASHPLHDPPVPEHRLPDVHPAPAHGEPPLAPLPERKEPVIFVHANRGETPMIRNWNELAKTTFLLTALAAAPVNNILAEVPGQATGEYTRKFEDLSKQIDELTKALTATEKRLDAKISQIKSDDSDSLQYKMILRRLKSLEEMIVDSGTRGPAAVPLQGAPASANFNLDAIKSKLDNIEQAIRSLQPAEKRVALSLPGPEPAAVKPATSWVIFVNLFSQDLGLWVNGVHHRAPAGKTLTLPGIAAGPTAIEVRWSEGIVHSDTPTLVPGETFTLTAKK